MRELHLSIHPNIDIESGSKFIRHATRGITLRGEDILLLYTERYHDYSLPGGGIDDGEDHIKALKRELREETGAKNITNIKAFGVYEEYRPWYMPDFDIMHMLSYCYTCNIDKELGDTQLEHYEVANGMKPVWINIHTAIAHNEKTISESSKKGMSINRETFLLKLIVKELITP